MGKKKLHVLLLMDKRAVRLTVTAWRGSVRGTRTSFTVVRLQRDRGHVVYRGLETGLILREYTLTRKMMERSQLIDKLR